MQILYTSHETSSQSGFQPEIPDVGHEFEHEIGQRNIKFVAGIVMQAMRITEDKVDARAMPPYRLAEVYIGPNERFVFFWYWSLTEKRYKREKVRVGRRGMHADALKVLLTNVCNELNKEFKLRNRKLLYHPEDVVSKKAGRSNTVAVADLAQAASQDTSLKTEIQSCYSKLSHNLRGFEKAHPAFTGFRPSVLDDRLMTQFVKYLQAEGKASKTINDLVWSMGKLAKRLRSQGVALPVVDYEQHRVQHIYNETNKYIPLTHAEKERAFSYFREHCPEYYLFLLFVYYTCIRPAELFRLQVKQIDLTGNKIHVPWFSSKNGLSNYVQILEPLRQAVQDYGVDKLQKDLYLFTNNCKPGKEMVESKITPKIWLKHREKMEMPTGKSAYGLKHTFNIDYVENNKHQVDWEWLRRHNRHATVMQTQQYISGLTAYFIDETKHVILNYHK